MIPCLLVLFSIDVLRTILCRLVCRNLVELNFVKTGLKCKFGVNPQSFSHELSLYVQCNKIHDAHAADHMVRFTRPSGSVFAYCKRSKTGAREGLGMRLQDPRVGTSEACAIHPTHPVHLVVCTSES